MTENTGGKRSEAAKAADGDESTKSKDATSKEHVMFGEDWGELHDLYIGIGSWPGDKSEVESLSDSHFRVLNFLESGSAISVMEDLLQEIIILKYVIGAPVVSSGELGYRPLNQRFETELTPRRLFPEVDSNPELTTPIKLQRDRQLVQNAVEDTLRTLVDDGTFEPISEAARALIQEYADEQNLVHEVKQNLAYMRDVKARVKEKRRADDLEERQRDEFLYKLQDEVDDVSLTCSIDEKFVDKWEQTRDKQNKWRLRDEEEAFRSKIAELETKSQLERRVTEEMQLFIKGDQMELEEQLEEWMARYDAEMERRENKILQLKYTRDQTEEEVKRLEDLYVTREHEMKEWIKFREQRKRRSAASLVIQCWWRGFMVRKKIGPYKEKKRKGGKGDKKK